MSDTSLCVRSIPGRLRVRVMRSSERLLMTVKTPSPFYVMQVCQFKQLRNRKCCAKERNVSLASIVQVSR